MTVPVIEVLGYDQVFEVIVDGPLVVLEERVGVAQAVAGLGLHCPVLQLPGQLQGPPAGHKAHTALVYADARTIHILLNQTAPGQRENNRNGF